MLTFRIVVFILTAGITVFAWLRPEFDESLIRYTGLAFSVYQFIFLCKAIRKQYRKQRGY